MNEKSIHTMADREDILANFQVNEEKTKLKRIGMTKQYILFCYFPCLLIFLQ